MSSYYLVMITLQHDLEYLLLDSGSDHLGVAYDYPEVEMMHLIRMTQQ